MSNSLSHLSPEAWREKLDTQLEEIPPLSTSVAKILEVARDPNASANLLNQLITADPVLMARVLKLINSAFYAMRDHVTSVVKAITMLGINTIKNLALSCTVVPAMNDLMRKMKRGALSIEGFWRHSLATGVLAKLMAEQDSRIDRNHVDSYFMVGMMHGIGKLLLSLVLEDKYHPVIHLAQVHERPLIEVEQKNLPVTHQDASVELVDKWNLQTELKDAVVHLYAPESAPEATRHLVSAVHVANAFASVETIGFSGDPYPKMPDEETWQRLGLQLADLYAWKPRILERIDAARVFLTVEH